MTERQAPFEPRPEPDETYEVRLPLTETQEAALVDWICRFSTGGNATPRDLMHRIGVLKHD